MRGERRVRRGPDRARLQSAGVASEGGQYASGFDAHGASLETAGTLTGYLTRAPHFLIDYFFRCVSLTDHRSSLLVLVFSTLSFRFRE